MNYNNVTDVLRRGEKAITDFWNVLDYPNFPFVTLTSTTNGLRNFPPYNIIESEDGSVRLEMAVAGYTKDRITVEMEGNILLIKGTPSVTKEKETLRHRGISNAAFLRTFEMNPNAKVANVTLQDGILTVNIGTVKPATPPRTSFEIK